MPTYSNFMSCIHISDVQLGVLETKKLQSSAVKKIVATCVDSEEEVDLSNFSLSELPDDVFLLIKLKKIRRFSVSNNLLMTVPVSVASMINLTNLNISNNQISKLPRELVHCKNLETLNISMNSFVEVPHFLWDLKTLQQIVATKNFISEVDENLLYKSTLMILDIRDNPLTTNFYKTLSVRKENDDPEDKLKIVFSNQNVDDEDWTDLSI